MRVDLTAEGQLLASIVGDIDTGVKDQALLAEAV